MTEDELGCLNHGEHVVAQTAKGAITAKQVKTFNGKSLLLENTGNRFDSIIVDSGSDADIAGDVRIKDNANALTVAINRKVAVDISVQNLREGGSLKNDGNLTAMKNLSLGALGNLTQTANTIFTAGKVVTLSSTSTNMNYGGILQDATAGIRAQSVIADSFRGVDLQGAGNQFGAITVQNTAGASGLNGNVWIKDSADKLDLEFLTNVNGDIAVENKKAGGVLQVNSELHAFADETTQAGGSISLTSDGSMQTDKKITADKDVKLKSTSGAMTTNGDISTVNGDIKLDAKGAMQTNAKLTAGNDVKMTADNGDVSINSDIRTGQLMPEPEQTFLVDHIRNAAHNSLSITAGGVIQEAEDVKIETPVVEIYSGKGVSLESVKNRFAIFLADGGRFLSSSS